MLRACLFLSSKVAVQFCILTSSEWEFLLLYVLANIWHHQCFGPSNRCVVVSHCCLILNFLITHVNHLYICLLIICLSSLDIGHMSVPIFCPFLIEFFIFLLFNFMSSFIFWITVLYPMCLLPIFSLRLWFIYPF